MRLRRK
jgi:hypothetical protein